MFQKKNPLKKLETLQTAIARFEAKVRKLTTHCTDREDEAQMKTSYARGNRLEDLAISNKQTGIKGMPIITNDEAGVITGAILAMRVINQRKHKEAHDQGTLRLVRRPKAYKGTAHAWLRNLKGIESQACWATELSTP